GHGAHPARVGGAAAFRLAGPPFSVPAGFDLATAAPAAPSPDLRAGNEPGIVRVRRAQPPGLRRLLRIVRVGGPGDALLPRAVRALRVDADAGAGRLPGEHAPGRTRPRARD